MPRISLLQCFGFFTHSPLVSGMFGPREVGREEFHFPFSHLHSFSSLNINIIYHLRQARGFNRFLLGYALMKEDIQMPAS